MADVLTAEGRAAIYATGVRQVIGADGVIYYSNGTAYRMTSPAMVNTATAQDQNVPHVAPLANGGHVVVWGSYGQDSAQANWGVYLQRYDAAGARSGGEVRVNITTAANEYPTTVLSLADGGFMVIWNGEAPLGETGVPLRGQRYLADGSAVGGEIDIATTTYQLRDVFEPLAGGGFVRVIPENGAVYGYLYDAAGARIGGSFMVNPVDRNTVGRVSVAAVDDGGFLVAYQASTFGPGGVSNGLEIQRFNSSGARIATIKPLAESGILLSITALEDDRFVLVTQADGAYTFQVHTVGGSTVDQPRTVAAANPPVITALTDGGFVAVWHQNTGSGTGAIQAARFDAYGLRVGDVLDLTAPTNHTFPTVADLADGGYVVTWSAHEFGPDDVYEISQLRVDYHTLRYTEDVINGGDGDTVVVTTPINIWRDDYLTGGAGIDTIELSASGALGLSELGAFSGFERVLGASGADIIAVTEARLAGVTLIDGRGGADTVTYFDDVAGRSVSLQNPLFANIENLGGSNHNDILTGDANANTLTGNEGADVLYGLAGNDVLIGGSSIGYGSLGYLFEGNNFLFGGAGNDTYYVGGLVADGSMDLVFEGVLFDGSEAGANDVDAIHLNGQFFWDYYSVGEVLYIDRPVGGGAHLIGGRDVANKTIYGSSGFLDQTPDYISTYGGNARVDAGRGVDVISFSLYDLDESYRGSNTVVMKPGSSMDYIYEFRSGVDHVDLTAFNFGITGAQVLAQAVNVDNAGTANDYCYFYLTDAGSVQNFIVFMGLLSSQLAAGDFIT